MYQKTYLLTRKCQYALSIFIFAIISFCHPPLKAEDKTLYIVTPVWKDWTNSNGSGYYFDLVNLIYKPLGYKIVFDIAPFSRAKKMVELKEADAAFSLYASSSNKEYITPKHSLTSGDVVIMFSKTLEWEGITSLNQKDILYPQGYNFIPEIPVDFNHIEVSDSKTGILMLMRGRASYFITNVEEMTQILQELHVDMSLYRVEYLYSKKLFMGFSNTDKGKLLAEQFDQRMTLLINSGQIDKLNQKWNLKN
mgnify:CR=1 FL=1